MCVRRSLLVSCPLASDVSDRLPGACSQFQSHQIFHVLVVAAAMVHYHGVSELAMHRLTNGECASEQHLVL